VGLDMYGGWLSKGLGKVMLVVNGTVSKAKNIVPAPSVFNANISEKEKK